MTVMEKEIALFSGSVYPELAEEISNCLGLELGNIKLEKFANGEIYARYLESIRGVMLMSWNAFLLAFAKRFWKRWITNFFATRRRRSNPEVKILT